MIEKSKSPLVCPTFYVNKHFKQKRGKPRMMIHYSKSNDALMPIRHSIPNKEDLLHKIHNANVFSKFDLKSGFWQIGIAPKDRYKSLKLVLLFLMANFSGMLLHLD